MHRMAPANGGLHKGENLACWMTGAGRRECASSDGWEMERQSLTSLTHGAGDPFAVIGPVDWKCGRVCAKPSEIAWKADNPVKASQFALFARL